MFLKFVIPAKPQSLYLLVILNEVKNPRISPLILHLLLR
jgi:hypothetical protein